MEKNITPGEADKLNEIWGCLQRAFDLMEDLRPSGGFENLIDKNKYCRGCGREYKN